LRRRSEPPAVYGALALAPLPSRPPLARPDLRLVVAPDEPDRLEARARAWRLAQTVAEIVSGVRSGTQLRPYATASAYIAVQRLARVAGERGAGRFTVRSSDGRAPREGIAEGYAHLRARAVTLTLAFRLERDAPTRRPTCEWLCTALEHNPLP